MADKKLLGSFGDTADVGFVKSSGNENIAGIKTFTNGISFGNETLSQYDEGVWVPSLSFGGATTRITYSVNRYGQYTRIGNRCFFNCYFVLTSKGTATGAMQVNDLPFTAATPSNGGYSAVTLWFNGVSGVGSIIGYVTQNSTRVDFELMSVTANAQTPTALTQASVTNTASFMISGHYIIA